MVGSHIVPRFYLEQFAVKKKKSAKSGHLWVYAKDSPPRQGIARSEGVENGYFAFPLPSGGVDESTENALAVLEDRANDVLVMAPSQCFVWSLRHKRTMAEYIGLMFARSRGRREASEWVHGKVSELMRRLQKDGFFGEIAAEYSRKHSQIIEADEVMKIVDNLANSNTNVDNLRKGFLEDLMSNAQLVTDQIVQKDWQVWCAADSCDFVTSDTPVVTALPINEELAPGVGFNVAAVLTFFPLNPRTCLVVGKTGAEHVCVPAEKVGKINDLVIRFMRKHVYSRTRDSRIEQRIKQFGGEVQFGKNAFIPRADHIAILKGIIRRNLGLEPA